MHMINNRNYEKKRLKQFKRETIRKCVRKIIFYTVFRRLIIARSARKLVVAKLRKYGLMEDDKRSEASPKPSQPTPFSIADILSRRTSCADSRRCDLEKIQAVVSAPMRRHNRDYERVAENEQLDGNYDHDQVIHYPRLPTPELSMAHELDILRRNLAEANLSNFGNIPHLTQGTFKHHLETLENLTAYQPVKEPMETSHIQQDEALDMSKNKYLGT